MDNNYNMQDLLDIVAKLRDEKTGCPWDKAQTHESIRQNFIEEAYEAVDAINKKDTLLLKEELGDVLLQVLLHAQFEKEVNNFDFNDVVNMLSEKLIVRHPHIFKDVIANNESDALDNWETIKNEVNGYTTLEEKIKAIPENFPALMYAQKLQKRANAGNAYINTKEKSINDIESVLKILKSDNNNITSYELGKLMFEAVNLIRLSKFDAEETLKDYSQNKTKLFCEFDSNSIAKDLEV